MGLKGFYVKSDDKLNKYCLISDHFGFHNFFVWPLESGVLQMSAVANLDFLGGEIVTKTANTPQKNDFVKSDNVLPSEMPLR